MAPDILELLRRMRLARVAENGDDGRAASSVVV
jgi:hypothetical protein